MPKLNRTTGKTTHARQRAIQNTDASLTKAQSATTKRGLLSALGVKPTGKKGKRG